MTTQFRPLKRNEEDNYNEYVYALIVQKCSGGHTLRGHLSGACHRVLVESLFEAGPKRRTFPCAGDGRQLHWDDIVLINQCTCLMIHYHATMIIPSDWKYPDMRADLEPFFPVNGVDRRDGSSEGRTIFAWE